MSDALNPNLFIGVGRKRKLELYQLANRLSIKLMQYYVRSMPDYADHGKYHSIRICKLLQELFKEKDLKFTEGEKYLLYASAWLHDLGCIRKRKGHADESAKIIKEYYHLFDMDLNPKAVRYITTIVKAHSKKFKLDRIEERCTLFKRDDIRLRYIAAIFRIIDSCDISISRANSFVFKLIKKQLERKDTRLSIDKKHIPYWEAHQNITNVKFDISKREIIVEVIKKKKAKLLVDNIKNEITSAKKYLGEDFPFTKCVFVEILKEW